MAKDFDLTYEDIDLGFDALFSSLSKGDGVRVETGLFDPEQARIGAYQEFGTRDIPARPWLSVAADTGVVVIERAGADALRDYGPKSSVKAALGSVGDETAKHTKGVILAQQVGGPPLQADTVDRKGHALKLIDSGEMLAAIESKVLERGEE